MVFGGAFGRHEKSGGQGGASRERGQARERKLADIGELVATFPGPAFLADRAATVLVANPAAHDLTAALEAGGLPDLRSRLARVSDLQESVQESVELGEAAGSVLFQLTLLPLATPGGGDLVLILARDATMERNLTAALVASRQMFKDLVECSTDFAWETDAEGCFHFVSMPGVLGYSTEALEGRLARTICATEAGHAVFETRERLERREIVLLTREGVERIFQISARPVLNPGGTWGGARGVAQDVTEERRRSEELRNAHERLEHRSRIDDLTGVLNRRAFMEELARRLRQMERHGRSGCLIYIDLNNFKSVNDAHGHATGDTVLRAFAQAMQEACRDADLVARLGGDEFGLWLEDCDLAGAERKARVLRRIVAELRARFGSAGAPLGIALGIAMRASGDQEFEEDLLARADAAMYRDKAMHRDKAMYRDKDATIPEGTDGGRNACSAGSSG